MTQVINLFGGPGSGKSTTAAAIFARLKMGGANAELVTEYVKKWVWRGYQVGKYDQIYLFGKQAHAESSCYDKVDYIVTDSPLLLSAFYENHFAPGSAIVGPSVFRFIEKTPEVIRHNFFLHRRKPYNPAGRYQTEQEAKDLDGEMLDFLTDKGVPFTYISETDDERAEVIIEMVTQDLV